MENNLKRTIRNKLNSKAGESISETLVALLISALALVMLAGVISASSRMITTTRAKLDKYYNANNYVATLGTSGAVDGASKETYKTITIKKGSSDIQSLHVDFYKNDVFSQYSVTAYKK